VDTLGATITAMKKENFLLPEIINLVTRVFMGWDKCKDRECEQKCEWGDS
jgi:hypothetical protein